VKKKNLNPTWNEEFQFPISSWDLPNILVLHVLDKDFAFFHDSLGSVSYPLICHFLFFGFAYQLLLIVM
jgi:Ca2+-dependent lipid-binding protein